METFAEGAIAIIDEMHTERLDYTSEYIPLINAAHTLEEYEETGMRPEEVRIMREEVYRLRAKLARYEKAEQEGRLVELPCRELLESRGDYLYMIYDAEIVKVVSCSVQIDTDGTVYVTCCADDKIFPYREGDPEHDTEPSDWCTKYIDFDASDFGKTVFFTEESAKAVLNAKRAEVNEDE